MLNLFSLISEQVQCKIIEGQGPGVSDGMKQKRFKTNFRLPINYLEQTEKYSLSETVSQDLELVHSPNKPIYEILFQPNHQFARDMIPEWNKYYSTNTDYLNDTKSVLKNMKEYVDKTSSLSTYKVDHDVIKKIWHDTKENEDFYLKYGYLDWEMLKYLNQSSSFLEAITLANIISPVASLLVPIMLMIFPFIILKIQNVPIDFETYFDVLKTIAQHHFIGKAITSLSDITPDKMIYLMMTFGLYLMQLYQNINQCRNFYENINTINSHLCETRDFVNHSIISIETFLLLNKNVLTYQKFIHEMEDRLAHLQMMATEFENIQPFEISIYKFSEMGYLLKCYYELHSNSVYEEALLYATGFVGYIDNLTGIYGNLKTGNIHFAEFDSSIQCDIKQQYYPPLIEGGAVKNDCSMKKNIILSSPNAGGKTTMIKTTTLNIIFSQQIGCGFYNNCTMTPYTHIHSYLNIPDTSGRDSLFQAESRRCKEIIDIISQSDTNTRHFCIFDELYSGTNPLEATKSAYAFLVYLNKFENVNYMLTTHYVSICKKLKRSDRVQNYKMHVLENNDGSIDYTYKMKRGISRIQGAVKILQQMNYPEEIIECIRNYK